MQIVNLIYENEIKLKQWIEIYKLSNFNNILIQIFTSNSNKKFISKVINTLTQFLPKATIIGATTDGEIYGEMVVIQKTIISFAIFEKTTIKSFASFKEDDFSNGKNIAKNLIDKNSKLLILFADGLNTNGEELLRGVNSINKSIAISGGLAGDYSKFKKSYIFTNDKILDNGVVGVSLSGENLIVNRVFNLNWEPIGKNLTITKADKNRVYTIDNLSAYETYSKYLGEDIAKKLPFSGVEFPLIIKRDDKLIARAVLCKNSDNSLTFAGNFKKGDKVQFSYGNAKEIIEGSQKLFREIQKKPIEAIFIYSCMARRKFMAELAQKEIEPLAKIAPTVGFFTYGEFFSFKDKSELLNESLTVLTLFEKNTNSQNLKCSLDTTQKIVDNNNLDTIKALSHLIKETTKEINTINFFLKEQSEQLKIHQELISNVVNATDDLIFYKSINDLTYIGCNSAFAKFLGLSQNEIIGSDNFDLLDERYAKKLTQIEEQVIHFKQTYTYSGWFKRYDNKDIYFEVKYSPLKRENGNIFGIVGVARDVTKELQIKQRLGNITSGMGEGLYVSDKNGICTFINPAGLEILGYKKEEVLAKRIHDLIHYKNLDGTRIPFEKCPIDNVIKANKIYKNSNEVFLTKDGTFLNISCTATPLIENEKIVGSITVFKDITEFKKTQEALIEAKTKEIELLKYEERYHSQQQQNAFNKQLKMINDDLSNIKIENLCIETYFKPLDILSGDTYDTVHIGDGKSFFCLIDAMGKGLSASVTSIQSISFINHSVKVSLERNDFKFSKVIKDYQSYIKRHLLEDEMVAILFMLLDLKESKIYIANFGMPPLLLHTDDDKLKFIRANNTPIMSFLLSQNIDEYSITNLKKIFIHSDGLNETLTKDNFLYEKYLDNDFLTSMSKKELLSKIKDRVEHFEDDVTFILLNILPINLTHKKTFKCKNIISEIDKLLENVRSYFNELEVDFMIAENLSFVLYELAMNAYEHGNLGISFELKDSLIQKELYDKYLKEQANLAKNMNKEIIIKVEKHYSTPKEFLQITMIDEGEGFDVAKVFKYLNFKQNLKYNGRGILMSENLSDGVFYNFKGNEVTVIGYL